MSYLLSLLPLRKDLHLHLDHYLNPTSPRSVQQWGFSFDARLILHAKECNSACPQSPTVSTGVYVQRPQALYLHDRKEPPCLATLLRNHLLALLGLEVISRSPP